MNLLYERGKRLVIELTDTNVFEGDYEAGTKNRMDLINIVDYYNRNAVGGILSFYINEIKSIRELSDKSSTECADTTEEETNYGSLPEAELERLQQITLNYIYIDKTEKTYLDALDLLVNCENIGIVGLGPNFSITKPVNLLVLSTYSQAYILNLTACCHSNFPLELKDLLESQYVKKVGHGLAPLISSLWHLYRVSINNVFDTQVADENIETNKGNSPAKSRSLSDCLNIYLCLPSLLKCTPTITSEVWSERPLEDFRKIEAAQLVAYLITLMNIQKKLLLKRYYDPIDAHLKKIYNSECYHPHIDFTSNVIPSRIKEIFNSF